jgi:hypothetical protein
MTTTILPRSDGAYRAWADSQMDVWYDELEEEEEEEEATFGNPKGEAAQ